jgi:hypothetical protein
MENGAGDPENAGKLAELRGRLAELKNCAGPSCKTAEGI